MHRRGRILIVDDAVDNLHVLLGILKDGWDVQAATSGAKALKLAHRSPQPDIILLDVVMPELDGYQTFVSLREDPVTQNIPVIFVTGLVDSDDQVMALDMGAADYIMKPFVAKLVRARLRNHLELKLHRDALEEAVQQRTRELMEADSFRQKVQAELEVAKRLQLSMLPATVFHHQGWELGCLLQAARAVGGDLYDYFFHNDKRLFFVTGDVSDKGVPAALFMVRVSTLLRTLAPSATDPGELLRLMNDHLCQDNQACMFVTMVCGLLDLETGEVWLASGGHEPPLQLRKGGPARYLEVEGGPALGLCPGAVFSNHRFLLEAGESLLLYTDGVTEAADGEEQAYGPERLMQLASLCCDDSPGHLVAGIAEALRGFVNQAEQHDDITLFAIRSHIVTAPPVAYA